MLTMNGVPIKNCLDYYEHFDVSEIVDRAEEFFIFAKSHLDFDPISHYCISLLGNHSLKDKVFPYPSEKFFWASCKIPADEIPAHIRSIVSECFIYYQGKKASLANWWSTFIVATAATILAKKNHFVSPESIIAGKQDIDILFSAVDESAIELTSGKTYKCKYDPQFEPTGTFSIRTVKLFVPGEYSLPATLHLDQATALEIQAGKYIFVNVCNDTVVRILPDRVKSSSGFLRRDFERRVVKDEDRTIPIPLEASSYACIGDAEYLYIQDQRLYYIGKRLDRIPAYLFNYATRYVEVISKNTEYYLLTTEGIIKTKDGTPMHLRSHYVSISQALAEE